MVANELKITVQNDEKVVSRLGTAEANHTIDRDKLRMQEIGLFQEWLKIGKLTERRAFELLGTLLYNLLFGTDVKSQFEMAFQEIKRTPGERLRVRLSFQEEATRLAGLPWEYLYCPASVNQEGFFLATETHLVLTRYIPLNMEQEPDLLPPEQDPLRILLVVAQPTGLDTVLYKPVIDAINKLGERYPIKTQEFAKPTVSSLRRQIEEYQPHVLHFIGHGRYNEAKRRGEIALLAADDSAAWKTDHDFTSLFQSLASKPRLIVLQACEGAVSGFADDFAGLALRLMRAETPAVVAMQYPITNEAALVFSRGFYEALAEGHPVDDAVQEGRRAIVDEEMELADEAYSSRSFGTPVLHMNSESGIVLVEPGIPLDNPGLKAPDPLQKSLTTNTQSTLRTRSAGTSNPTGVSAEFRAESRQPSPAISEKYRGKPADMSDVLTVLDKGMDTIDQLQLNESARDALEHRMQSLSTEIAGLSIRDIEQHLRSILADANPDLGKVIFAMILATRRLQSDDVRRPAI
jgi:hypothetical protein